VLSILVFQRLAAGKSAQVLVDPDRKHSYTPTPYADGIRECVRSAR
jgi:hypothetical protein